MPDSEQTLDFPSDSCRWCGAGLDRRARFCSVCGTSVIPGEVPVDGVAIRDLADPEYMGFWIRLAAELIDYVFIIIAVILLQVVADFTSFVWVLAVPVIIYFAYKHLKCQTPGRKLLKIRVVNAKGEDVGFWRGAFREQHHTRLSIRRERRRQHPADTARLGKRPVQVGPSPRTTPCIRICHSDPSWEGEQSRYY